MAPTSTASRPTPTARLRKVDQFPALRSVETNEQTRTLAWKQVRPRSSINNDDIEPESTHDGWYDFARAVGRCRRWPLRSRSIRQHNRGAAPQAAEALATEHAERGRNPVLVVDIT